MRSDRDRVDERDVLPEVGDDQIDAACSLFMTRTDRAFFDAVDTMAAVGISTPGFVRTCDRLISAAREVREIIHSLR